MHVSNEDSRILINSKVNNLERGVFVINFFAPKLKSVIEKMVTNIFIHHIFVRIYKKNTEKNIKLIYQVFSHVKRYWFSYHYFWTDWYWIHHINISTWAFHLPISQIESLNECFMHTLNANFEAQSRAPQP